MKKNRRITAILTAACLTMPLACTAVVPFSAVAAGTNSITVSGTTNSDIAAYQVFKGTYSDNVLGVTGWGSGINSSGFLTALKGSSAFGSPNPFAEASTAVKVAEIISGFTNNSDKANEVARLALQNVSTTSSGSVNGNVISNLDDGYYVVKDKTTATTGETAWTLGLLQVAGGNVTVAPKTSYPTVEKEVKVNSVDWGKAADYEYGSAVPFKTTVTLPSDINLYEHYYVEIIDELDDKFKAPTNVTLKIGTNYENATTISASTNCRTNINANDLTISIEDVKALKENISPDDKIFIEYNSIIQNASTCGVGQACVYYSNDPNAYDYQPNIADSVADKPTDGNYGTSPKDIVKVYAYGLQIHKQDGVTKADLAGATFKIKNSEGKWAKVVNDETNDISSFEWVSNEADAETYTTLSDGDISISGLDAGTYYIKEAVAPEGYNVLDSDIKLEIIPEYNGSELTNVVYKKDDVAIDNSGYNKQLPRVTIENNKGKTLPTTGGIGTKIFYIVGGMLVIGSGAALVIKKRIGKDEE